MSACRCAAPAPPECIRDSGGCALPRDSTTEVSSPFPAHGPTGDTTDTKWSRGQRSASPGLKYTTQSGGKHQESCFVVLVSVF